MMGTVIIWHEGKQLRVDINGGQIKVGNANDKPYNDLKLASDETNLVLQILYKFEDTISAIAKTLRV